jgi:ubiquinone/menaquinone biosynthesis C-methylase UbiE
MSYSTPDTVASTILAYHNGAKGYAEYSRDQAHLDRLREPLIAILPPEPLVLDLGSGPGHDAALLADRGATVVALDPALGLLREAHAYELIASRLVGGDARQLPFADARFDGIWSCASLLHVPHEEVSLALSEAFRVLKPGGVAFFSMSEGEPSGRVLVSDIGLATRGYYYHRGAGWASLLCEAGFELVEHRVNRTSGHFNVSSTGWIETYARRP